MLWFHLFSWQNIQIWSSLAEKKPPISTHLNRSIISKYDVIKCFFGSKCIQWPLYSTTFVFVADQFIILYCPCAPTQGFASLGHVRSCHPNVKTTEQFVYQGLWLIHYCDGATCQGTFYESPLTCSEIYWCLAVLLAPERLYCYTVSQIWRLTV